MRDVTCNSPTCYGSHIDGSLGVEAIVDFKGLINHVSKDTEC